MESTFFLFVIGAIGAAGLLAWLARHRR